VRVVLAGRERPDRMWAATYGELLIELPLGNLAASDVEALLDTSGRHLRLGEQRIPLTELELALVAYLSEPEGQAA
jgi:hypothetical protein